MPQSFHLLLLNDLHPLLVHGWNFDASRLDLFLRVILLDPLKTGTVGCHAHVLRVRNKELNMLRVAQDVASE